MAESRKTTGRFTRPRPSEQVVRQLLRGRRDAVTSAQRGATSTDDPQKIALVERAKRVVHGDEPGGAVPGGAA